MVTLNESLSTLPISHFTTSEDYGMSLHLQISTELNDGSLRLEWVRMPLKSDATLILDYDGF